jgi:hypothetical protein
MVTKENQRFLLVYKVMNDIVFNKIMFDTIVRPTVAWQIFDRSVS